MFMEKNVNVSEEEVKNNRFKRVKRLAGIAACATIGYLIGYKVCNAQTNIGLDMVCKTDPTLKEHMATAIAEATKQKLLQN